MVPAGQVSALVGEQRRAGSGSHGSRGPILLGSVLAGVSAYLSVRFLLRYLRTRTLTPFGVYCLVAGLASLLYVGLGG